MKWEVDISLIRDWLDKQDRKALAKIVAALGMLEESGPSLGRPLVDRIKGSSIHNLKELRLPVGSRSEIRILFVFDAERKAILLVGGDKATGKNKSEIWSGWYMRHIPLAERRYARYLKHKESR